MGRKDAIKRAVDECQEDGIFAEVGNNDIPWHAIKAMRNLHAHDYENVDLDIVWNTLTVEIPDLKSKFEQLL